MAIEPIKKVTIISPRNAKNRLMRTINRLGVMEIVEQQDIAESKEASLGSSADSSTKTVEDIDGILHKIDFILNLMNAIAPEQQSFVQGLAPVPLVTSPQELDSIIEKYDLEGNFKLASEVDERYRSAERVIGEITSELKDLEPLSNIPYDIADFQHPGRVRLVLGDLPKKNLALLGQDIEPWSRAAWEEIASGAPQGRAPSSSSEEWAQVVIAFLPQDGETIRQALAGLEFNEIALPKLVGKIPERIVELRSTLVEYQEKAEEVVQAIKHFSEGHRSDEGRRPLLILKAYWQNVKNTRLATGKGLQGNWVFMISGYIREKDAAGFMANLKREFPESDLSILDPGPDENVPVSFTLPSFCRPLQLLVEMFGLPPYQAFDPTPFLQVNFYLFFGICFSDVCYGIMLAILGAYLSSKTKVYRGVNNFARILLYGGISSIIFGAVLGSWFGDLYKPVYLGEGNFLLYLQKTFVVLDPIDKTIVALVCALGIGVLNQFFGLALKMYGAIKHKDFMGAFSDGICWMVTLSGLLLMVGKIFAEIPAPVFNTGRWLFFAGAVGLVLTQGREIKSLFGRFAGGVVSLYGIMGSYGITSFIGDTLSYCRLLALGLTTSIVAMSFNLMAGMLRDVPYVGFILFVVVLLVGHLFNFAISVLGAFVHSMRLIFVEFFGRFYEAGSRPFKPLGFDSSACIMKKPGKAD